MRIMWLSFVQHSKTCLKRPLKKTKNWFSRPKAGQKYCRILAIFSAFIKLPFIFKSFVWSILSGRLRQALLYYDSVCQCTVKKQSKFQQLMV